MEYYEPIQEDPFSELNNKYSKHLKTAIEARVISKGELRFLTIQQPSKALFYHLPKIHKDLINPLGRPVIPRLNNTTSNLSQYLYTLLQDYVRNQATKD